MSTKRIIMCALCGNAGESSKLSFAGLPVCRACVSIETERAVADGELVRIEKVDRPTPPPAPEWDDYDYQRYARLTFLCERGRATGGQIEAWAKLGKQYEAIVEEAATLGVVWHPLALAHAALARVPWWTGTWIEPVVRWWKRGAS
jgi:hypothetical protein